MPRVANVYGLPYPDVITQTPISSTVYNVTNNDIATDLNAARPIVAGGTGATSAPAALTNLGAVPATGGAMTGNITINNPAGPDITLNSTLPANGALNQIESQRNGLRRWLLQLGDGVAETGADAGSNFQLWGYGDAGQAASWSAMTINRASKQIAFPNTAKVGAGAGPNFTQSSLTVTRAAGGYAEITDGTHSTFIGGDAGGGFIGTYTNDLFAIRTNNVVRATVLANGIIQAGPSAKSGQGVVLDLGYGTGSQVYGIGFRPAADPQYAVVFINAGGAGVGNIITTASGTQFNVTSDGRMKEDLKTFDAGMTLDRTNVYDFKWKSLEERAYGIVAQEAIEVYPAAVTYTEKEDWWSIDYSKYVPLLIQEIKALRSRVAALEGSAPLTKPA